MNILGRKVEIELSEPWPLHFKLSGTVIRMLETKSHRQYIIVASDQSNEKYLVTNRYEYEKLNNLWMGKSRIVNVMKIRESVNIDNIDPCILDKTTGKDYSGLLGIGNLRYE